MIELEINGNKIQAEDGSTIIEAADSAGVRIPRFCYHDQLSVAANCRMCLVEVEKSRKPLPACATPATNGMKVFTKSKVAVDAQRSVMEYLLINHPLDCPVCDQGGSCELQDTSMGFGAGNSNYTEPKRSVAKKDIGPLIDTFMTRCIHCTRCVRFGQEVAGLAELGVTNRGEHAEIGTYVKHLMQSEVSGNVIDLCPVGALTSKPFLYKCRSWEMRELPGVAAHDCWGSNVNWHVRPNDLAENRQVMRVVPRAQDEINECWLSDRDRFSYTGLYHQERLLFPEVRQGRQGRELNASDWVSSLPQALADLQKTVAEHGADQVGVLVSSNLSCEDGYMLQHVMCSLGINNIEHRLRCLDVSDQTQQPAAMGMQLPISELETVNTFLLVGSNVRHEQPLAALKIRKAQADGAEVFALNAVDYNFNFNLLDKIIVAPTDWCQRLAALINAAIAAGKAWPSAMQQPDWISACAPSDQDAKWISKFLESEKAIIYLGADAYHHPQASQIRYLARALAECCGSELAIMSDGANSIGLNAMGVVPYQLAGGEQSPSFSEQNETNLLGLKAYVLVGIEPGFDCAKSGEIIKSIRQADFVVALTAYKNDFFIEHADILLPITLAPEHDGSLVNVNARMQTSACANAAPGQARPVWKIMRVMARMLASQNKDDDKNKNKDKNTNQDEFTDFNSITEKCRELLEKAQANKGDWGTDYSAFSDFNLSESSPESSSESSSNKLFKLGYWPMYAVDAQVRRAAPLQHVLWSDQTISDCHMNAATAAKHNLQNGDPITCTQDGVEWHGACTINSAIADNVVHLACGITPTAAWGCAQGDINIQKRGASDAE